MVEGDGRSLQTAAMAAFSSLNSNGQPVHKLIEIILKSQLLQVGSA